MALKHMPPMRRIAQMNYNWKITLLLITGLFVAAVLILAAFALSTGRTIRAKTTELTMERLESMKLTVETTLQDFDTKAAFVVSDRRIQDYLRTEEHRAENYTQLTNNANYLLTYLSTSNSYVDYICIYKELNDTLLYKGTVWTIHDAKERVVQGYNDKSGYPYRNMIIRTEPGIFHPDRYSLNFYQSIHNPYILGQEIGALIISVNHASFSEIYSSSEEETISFYITAADGYIISAADETLIGTASPIAGQKLYMSGSVEAGSNLILYSRMGDWGWYMVGSVPMDELLRDNRNVIRLMMVVIFLICAVCAFIAYRMSNMLYRPLRELVGQMTAVSGGDLSARMEEKGKGKDIEILANGFNNMLNDIERLMERVKREHHQAEQIRFNALQSQIQPHFLYNALDCIHWQAAMDGNKEVSAMVKELASYYRLCLSKGRDIVPLSQELAHVTSYLFIQNKRYDGIVKTQFDVSRSLEKVLIPKITLQPLVENAIYHGIKIKLGRTGKIIIRALEQQDHIIICVENDGIGLNPGQIEEINNSLSVHDDNFGYGVRNVHRRIEILFGKGYGLFYRQNDGGGVSVEINLPRQIGTEMDLFDVQGTDC